LNKPFLQNISDELKAELYELGNMSRARRSSLIFTEGDAADHLPVVLSGKVKMLHLLEGGKEVIIDFFEKGEMFAVPPVFDGGKYPASAVAMEDTSLLLIERKKFLDLLRRSPEFSFYIIGWMCNMLREKTATIQNLATSSPDTRIAHILLRLSEKIENGEPVKITLRRQEIAEMAGLTTETTIRVIRRLAELELIRIQRGKIFVDSPDPLKKYLSYRA
jgi:CRP/FNR family transcriptional regulator